MTDPKLIAVVPAPEWREALLGDGLCGSRAPMVARRKSGDHWPEGVEWAVCRAEQHDSDLEVALPLMIAGQPVPDGIARAARALCRVVVPPPLHSGYDAVAAYWNERAWRMDIPSAEWVILAEVMCNHGIASEVIIEEADNG